MVTNTTPLRFRLHKLSVLVFALSLPIHRLTAPLPWQRAIVFVRYKLHLLSFERKKKSQEFKHVWGDEFRCLTVWAVKLLCSLMAQQQVLLYLLSDGRWVLSFSVFGLCADISLHWCHWCSVDGTSDVLVVLISCCGAFLTWTMINCGSQWFFLLGSLHHFHHKLD